MKIIIWCLLFSIVTSAQGALKGRTVLGLSNSHIHNNESESLEYIFLKYMTGPCGIAPNQVASSLSSDTEIILSKTQVLQKFKESCSQESVKKYFSRYLDLIQKEQKKTAENLLILSTQKSWLYGIASSQISKAISILGPVKNSDRVDAFVLWAASAWSQNPRQFEKELTRALNPNAFLFKKAFEKPKSLSINETAILSLITHNHLAEQTLIIQVYAYRGVEAAWALLEQIDALYEMERKFWSTFDTLCFPELYLAYPDSHSDSASMNYCAAHLESGKTVPFQKSYHFWGALIAVNRLTYSINALDLISHTVFMGLGSVYKSSTGAELLDTQITLRAYEAASSVWK